jgi:undecaprenyl-diphosphatase
MPDLLKAALLGIVQGLTEFLPVSSTGHLVLLEEWFGVSEDKFGLTFDAAIHLGTLLAILVYFWPLIVGLAASWLRSIRSLRWDLHSDSRLAWLIVIGSLPAAALGFLFEDAVEDRLREPAVVATMLILFSGVLVLAERLGEKRRQATQLGVVGTLFVGFAQAVALIPGVSRSGITISAGLFAQLRRQQAALFAFLLSAPIIAGAGLKQVFDIIDQVRDGLLDGEDLAFFLTGLVLAAITGYLTIRFLLAYLREHSLYPFVAYRVTLGVVLLLIVGLS